MTTLNCGIAAKYRSVTSPLNEDLTGAPVQIEARRAFCRFEEDYQYSPIASHRSTVTPSQRLRGQERDATHAVDCAHDRVGGLVRLVLLELYDRAESQWWTNLPALSRVRFHVSS